MRIIRFAAAASLIATAGPALAADPAPTMQAPTMQAPAAATPAPAATPGPAAAPQAGVAPKGDPVVARVDGEEIHLSDVQEASAQIPEEYRNLPPQVLYPQIVEQLVDRRALLKLALARHLDQDPAVQKQMQRASQQALQNAVIAGEVGPTVTAQTIKARYDSTIGNKPGDEEVHARHILVADEAKAKDLIEKLSKGGDFAALAKENSTDPGAANGGDLGFFKKADMLPEFSAVAFALAPGEVSKTPVHTRYGWHVIKLEERRTSTPPAFEQSRDEIRQAMIQEGIQKIVKEARAGVKVETFNPDGSVPKPGDAPAPPGSSPAGPPPAAAPDAVQPPTPPAATPAPAPALSK